MMPNLFSAESLHNAGSIHNNTSVIGKEKKILNQSPPLARLTIQKLSFCHVGVNKYHVLLYYFSVRDNARVQADEVTERCLHVTWAGSSASQGEEQSSQHQSASSSFPQSLLHYHKMVTKQKQISRKPFNCNLYRHFQHQPAKRQETHLSPQLAFTQLAFLLALFSKLPNTGAH